MYPISQIKSILKIIINSSKLGDIEYQPIKDFIDKIEDLKPGYYPMVKHILDSTKNGCLLVVFDESVAFIICGTPITIDIVDYNLLVLTGEYEYIE